MNVKSLWLAAAVVSLGAFSGCASDVEFQKFKRDTNARLGDIEVVQRRHDQMIAFHTRELERVIAMHQRQIELVSQLQQSLAAVNSGMRNSVEQANRHWAALQTVQDDLSRMNALQKRFKPVRHGESWLLVYDDA